MHAGDDGPGAARSRGRLPQALQRPARPEEIEVLSALYTKGLEEYHADPAGAEALTKLSALKKPAENDCARNRRRLDGSRAGDPEPARDDHALMNIPEPARSRASGCSHGPVGRLDVANEFASRSGAPKERRPSRRRPCSREATLLPGRSSFRCADERIRKGERLRRSRVGAGTDAAPWLPNARPVGRVKTAHRAVATTGS